MILYLNPVNGISGDMLLGALVDLGAPVQGIRDAVATTGLTGWRLDITRTQRNGIVASKAEVVVAAQPDHRHAAELITMARRVRPAAVADLAVQGLQLLAEVEGRIHDIDPADVHLHELGGHDTIVDIVGVVSAIQLLGITEVYSSPVAIGSGTVRTCHGILPVPAPATAVLLEGAAIRGSDIPGETVTPTGALLLQLLGARYTPLPVVTPVRVGYGAGGRELPDRPNVLQATIGTALAAGSSMCLIETTVDDASGELLGTTLMELMQSGAADVWITPATMKKSRPGCVVHLLCEPMRAAALETMLLRLTGSLGLRRTYVDRVALPRSEIAVSVRGEQVRIKRGPWTAKPEHDDVVRAARELGITVQQVSFEALGQLDRPGC